MNTSMKKAISLVTCTALAAGCCTMAFAADSPVTKDENVFLFLNPDGSIQSQVVSDWLHSDNGLRGVPPTPPSLVPPSRKLPRWVAW